VADVAVFEVPLSPQAQRFTITLGGVSYQVAMLWRDLRTANAVGPGGEVLGDERQGCWVLDFATAEGAPILQGVPLVTGVDLLAPYATLGFVGSLVVQTDHDPERHADDDNLGSSSATSTSSPHEPAVPAQRPPARRRRERRRLDLSDLRINLR
jgi:hypothetical protein